MKAWCHDKIKIEKMTTVLLITIDSSIPMIYPFLQNLFRHKKKEVLLVFKKMCNSVNWANLSPRQIKKQLCVQLISRA